VLADRKKEGEVELSKLMRSSGDVLMCYVPIKKLEINNNPVGRKKTCVPANHRMR